MIRLLQDRSTAIVRHADCQSPPSLCFAEAGYGERCGTARGDSDDDIRRPNLVLLNKSSSLVDRVLGPFDRAKQRVPAPGNEQEQPLLRPTEGWNELRAVLDRKPAGGPGADINEPSALSQSFRGGQRCFQKREAGRADRSHRRELALDHRLGDVQRRPNVDVGISGACAFGIHGL